jgi:hypothetical protein
MKGIFIAVVLIGLTASAAARADQQNDAKSYNDGLDSALLKCSSMVSLQDHEDDLAQMIGNQDHNAVLARYSDERQKRDACEADAKAKSVALYNAFLLTTKSQQLKNDAKEVLVSWLSVLATIRNPDAGQQERSQLHHAESVLEVDAMTQ